MRNMIYLFSFRFLGVQAIITLVFLIIYTAWIMLFPEDFQMEDIQMVMLSFGFIYFVIFMSWGITYSNNLNWLLLTPLKKFQIFLYYVKLRIVNFIFGSIFFAILIVAIPFATKMVLIKNNIHTTMSNATPSTPSTPSISSISSASSASSASSSSSSSSSSSAHTNTTVSVFDNNVNVASSVDGSIKAHGSEKDNGDVNFRDKNKFKKMIKTEVIKAKRVVEFNVQQGDSLGHWIAIISLLILLFACLPTSVVSIAQQSSKDKILHRGIGNKGISAEIIYLFNYFVDFLIKKYFSVLVAITFIFVLFIFRDYTSAPIFVLFIFSNFVVILTVNNNFSVLKINKKKFKLYLNSIFFTIIFSLFAFSYILSYRSIKNMNSDPDEIMAQISYLGNFGPEIPGNDIVKLLAGNLSKDNFNRIINYRYFINNKDEIINKIGIKKFIENKNEWVSFYLTLELFDGVIFSDQDVEIILSKLDELNRGDASSYPYTLYVVSKLVNRNFSKSEVAKYLRDTRDTYQLVGIILSIIYGDNSLNADLLNLMKNAPFGLYRYLKYAISMINRNDFNQYELFDIFINKKSLKAIPIKELECVKIKKSISEGEFNSSTDILKLNLCFRNLVLQDKHHLLKYFVQCPVMNLPLPKCAKELGRNL
ncbi:MAG: hypothetical protein HQK49_06720 [Oligoflexia bacterium]|nr:hypothetical protein [Oligoflexia bacterium]